MSILALTLNFFTGRYENPDYCIFNLLQTDTDLDDIAEHLANKLIDAVGVENKDSAIPLFLASSVSKNQFLVSHNNTVLT